MAVIVAKNETCGCRHNRGMRRPCLAVSALLTCLLMACSPEHNWRQVGFEGTALKSQLPCKPDRTTREVEMAGLRLQLQVAGCESGSAMLAVMTASLPAGADAHALLQGWQEATLAHVQAQDVQRKPWSKPSWLPLASASQVSAHGQRSDGQPVSMQAAWGAIAEHEQVRLVHAVVYDRTMSPEMAQTLFDGVQP
jgi:hypothetical protein